jgi:hypothetical protein
MLHLKPPRHTPTLRSAVVPSLGHESLLLADQAMVNGVGQFKFHEREPGLYRCLTGDSALSAVYLRVGPSPLDRPRASLAALPERKCLRQRLVALSVHRGASRSEREPCSKQSLYSA